MPRTLARATALVAVLLLPTGCVPATESPAPGSRPDARTTATCDDLAPAGSFDPFFDDALELVGPERTVERLGVEFSEAWSTRQAGGIACDWQTVGSTVTLDFPDYQAVELRLLPASLADWESYKDPEEGDRMIACGARFCSVDVFVRSGWWLSLLALRLPYGGEERIVPVFDAIADRVRALPGPRSTDGPRSGDAIPQACGDQLASTEVARAAGVPFAIARPERWASFRMIALRASGGTRCTWQEEHDTDLAVVTVLPGGAWAMREAAEAHGRTIAAPLAGLDEPGRLRLEGAIVTIDLAVDGDWVRIEVVDDGALDVEPRDYVERLATAFVAGLTM